MHDAASLSYTSFHDDQRIATGTLAVNALAVKRALETAASRPPLTFCDQTGEVVEIDLRGSDADILARLQPDAGHDGQAASTAAGQPDAPRGRGRPKLGVIAREVTLLPRHWDWLAAQPGGASVSLRKLIDEARRASAEPERLRLASEATYRVMAVIAGDKRGFEEATRALFTNDGASLRALTEAWPADVREYVRQLAVAAAPSPAA